MKTLNLLFHTRMYSTNFNLYGTASNPYIIIEDVVSMGLQAVKYLGVEHNSKSIQQLLLNFLNEGDYVEFTYELGMERKLVSEIYVKVKAVEEFLKTLINTPEGRGLSRLLENLVHQVFEIVHDDMVKGDLITLSEELYKVADRPLNPYRDTVEHKENEFPLAYPCESDNLDIYIFEDGESPVVLADDVAKWMNVSRDKVLSAVRPSEMVVNTFKDDYKLFLYVDGIYRAVSALMTPEKAEAIIEEFNFHLNKFWMLEPCLDACGACYAGECSCGGEYPAELEEEWTQMAIELGLITKDVEKKETPLCECGFCKDCMPF